jgi:protein-S-isoprenylcysteine O-methyltransferase Ste14
MLDKILEILLRQSREKKSLRYKIVATLLGACLFLLIIPLILFFFGYLFETYLLPSHLRSLEKGFGMFCLVSGLLYVAVAVITLAGVGKGTPNPMAPTETFIASGPYKYSRNPIQLGAMFYYLGVGTVFGSIWIGLVMFVLIYIFGCTYHKFVEEKELLKRFGKPYEDYRDVTPFLIPKLWK